MAGSVDIEVRGLNELISKLSDGVSRKLKRDIGNAVGASLLDKQRQRFLQAVDPDGIPWPVSSAALYRAATGRGGKTLYDTGTLFNSIQFGLVKDDVGQIGTDVPYARKHQFGEDGLPVRKFLGFTTADAKSASVIAAAFIEKKFSG